MCVYQFSTPSISASYQSWCFVKWIWPKNLISCSREGSPGRQFTLDFLKKKQNQNQKTTANQGCVVKTGWMERTWFCFRYCSTGLISLRYLFETPTNIIYIFIRWRQGWHICVRRPPVHRRLHFYIAAFWKLAGEDGRVLNCSIRVFTAIQGTSTRTAHGFFHVICKAREIS